MSQKISLSELSRHSTESDCWIAVDGAVFDVTKFLKIHPAGKGVILALAGRDVTEQFYSYHRKEVLEKYGPKLRVGQLDTGTSPDSINNISPRPVFDLYTPFGESTFIRGWTSAYLNDGHRQFRAGCRSFLMEHVTPIVESMHEKGDDPSSELFMKMGACGMLASRCGPCAMPFVKQLNIPLPGGISPDDFSYFHEQIAIDEFYRIGSSGVSDGLGCGLTIGLPPVIHFGRKQLKQRIVPECLLGKKRICLAITEPQAGSDVANVQLQAKLNSAGTHYIVNGMKKWITGGYVADYYTAAVRTGGPGHGGISMLLIENPADPSQGTITKHKIKTSYSSAAGTSLLIFENVLVPKENLLGKENEGFKLIMANFNHERWFICAISAGFARNMLGEVYRWSLNRKAFGKRLIDQPVIRYKLAQMTAIVECLESWLESITFQMNSMDLMEQFEKLSSPIALCKFISTRYGTQLADNACQILGGRAVTRTGMGRMIEYFKNEVKLASILGGSEEIVADLAVRQAVAQCDRAVKSSGHSHLNKL